MPRLVQPPILGSPEVASRRPRFDLLVFAALLVTPALCTTAWLWSRAQTSKVEAEALERARELVARVTPRPAHAPPSGAVAASGTALGRDLGSLLSALRLDEADDAALRRAGRGELPPAELTPGASAAVERARPVVLEALAETRSAEASFPAEVRLVHPEKGGLYSAAVLHRLGSIVGLEVYGAIGAREGDRALALCLDGLALGRDLSFGSALIGQAARRVVQEDLAVPCAAAITAATPEAAAVAASSIASIAVSAPPIATTARDDATLMMVEAFGSSMSEPFQRALPRGLPALAPPDASRVLRWLRRDAVGDVWVVFGELERAMAVPRAGRASAFAEVGRRADRRVNPTASITLLDWGHWDSRDAETRARLVALATAAIARSRFELDGGWAEGAARLIALLPRELLADGPAPTLERLDDGRLRIAAAWDRWSGRKSAPRQGDETQAVVVIRPADERPRPSPPPRRRR